MQKHMKVHKLHRSQPNYPHQESGDNNLVSGWEHFQNWDLCVYLTNRGIYDTASVKVVILLLYGTTWMYSSWQTSSILSDSSGSIDQGSWPDGPSPALHPLSYTD